MGIGSLTNKVKLLGGMAIVVAVVLAILNQFTSLSVLGSTANTSINSFITAIGSVADWAAIIVIAIVGFYLLKLANMGKSN